jgi:hypothetical protein
LTSAMMAGISREELVEQRDTQDSYWLWALLLCRCRFRSRTVCICHSIYFAQSLEKMQLMYMSLTQLSSRWEAIWLQVCPPPWLLAHCKLSLFGSARHFVPRLFIIVGSSNQHTSWLHFVLHAVAGNEWCNLQLPQSC